MRHSTRRVLDRAFTGLGLASIALMAASVIVLLGPIVVRGLDAFIFRGTVEFRRSQLELFHRGDRDAVMAEAAAAQKARQPVYDALTAFDAQLKTMDESRQGALAEPYRDLRQVLHKLLGPFPGEPHPVMPHEQFGATRWDRAQVTAGELQTTLGYDYSDPTKFGVKVQVSRAKVFADTALAPLFPYVESHLEEMLQPRMTFYWGFLTDEPKDANFFGGLWPALLGTFYLTVGAMLFAVPTGVITAIYLVEYAGDSHFVSLLRTFISTLAGVPSIIFGLFGLAFFLNEMHVSPSKSVLAGSLTLALLVLPTVIRAAEEALRSVPLTYKEAALSLGASPWRAIVTVILPAALPGILTGIIISMGRAAGETAPIIFTAAVSVGQPLHFWEALGQPTQALPWNIYNVATENKAADEIRHVQYGMVLVLVSLVLFLNVAAIWLRARISRRLRA